jgi:uncharacterized membrane protein YkvA (DUF1232 family)
VLLGVALAAAAYAAFLAVLVLAGRATDARALARLVPDCAGLARRLAADARVPQRHKLALAALTVYLALPFDLVPDFLPVVGLLDDAILVALVVRRLLRAVGPELLYEHWRGTARGLELVLWLAAQRPGGWRTT